MPSNSVTELLCSYSYVVQRNMNAFFSEALNLILVEYWTEIAAQVWKKDGI